ncbi:OmpH family outer membrane protein [Pyramidobacter piscolens]|uniref:OmpH family outer membrane protein n=1 Tax=Pyramidobacter piscolens TaxID=638849 RepID=UPI00266584F8|nr:OmpH family outer membrane protein [Pyramidobacter piscolens]
MRRVMTIFLAVLLMGVAAGTAPATEIAVVDAERILAQSTPGKKGQEHLNEVQKVLQKGYNDLVALYRGRENSPEAQEIIRQGQAALEQQMAVERNAVLAVLQSELMAATEAWQKKNPKIQAVVSRQLLLGAVPKLDVTSAVMKEMNKRTPKFAALPTVTVNKPAPAQPAQK